MLYTGHLFLSDLFFIGIAFFKSIYEVEKFEEIGDCRPKNKQKEFT